MATSTNYGWAEPDNSSLVKNGASDMRTLGNAIDTSLWSSGFGQAGKNKIINGNFAIAQRGATFTNPTVNQYILDRWYFGGGGNLTGTISQQTFTPGTAPVAGYESANFLRYTGTVTTPNLIQRVEDVRTFAGQTVTLSFWAKANASLTLSNVNLYQYFGSGGSAGVDNASSGIAITTSWARYSFTTTLPSISGKTIGTGSYLSVQIQMPSLSSGTVDFWGFQLEAGSTATPFQTATGTIQGELAACQRYYQVVGSSDAMGSLYSSSAAVFVRHFPVNMRIAPTPTYPASLTSAIQQFGTGNATPTAVNTSTASTQSLIFYATGASGLSAAYPAIWAGSSIALSSEL